MSPRCAAKIAGYMAEYLELWFLPAVMVGAWFYYPYCQSGPTLCIWRAVFRKPCLACGLTRSLCFLMHGRVREAISYNPLCLVFMFATAVNFFWATYEKLMLRLAARRSEFVVNKSGYVT